MTNLQFVVILRALSLTPSSKRTAALLGLSVRQVQRIAAETCAVPAPVAKLLEMYRVYGIPADD